jgi:FeS assembly protein IscX
MDSQDSTSASSVVGETCMKWTDSEQIGMALSETFPDLDPLTLRFTDLRDRIVALDGFDDDPARSNEPKLEAIQMAWYEEWKDGRP